MAEHRKQPQMEFRLGRTLAWLLLVCSSLLLLWPPAPLVPALAQSLPAASDFAFPTLVIGVCATPSLSVALAAGISLRVLHDAQYAEAGIRVGIALLQTSARVAIKDIVEVQPSFTRVDLQCDQAADSADVARQLSANITSFGVHVVLGGVSDGGCRALALASANSTTPWISYFCDHAATDGVEQPAWPPKWTHLIKTGGAGSALGISSAASLGAPFGPSLFYKLKPTSVDSMQSVMDLYLQLQWLFPWTHESQDQTQISMLYSAIGATLAHDPLVEMLRLVRSNLTVAISFNQSATLDDRQTSLIAFQHQLLAAHAASPNTQLHMVVLFLNPVDVLPFMETAQSIPGWWGNVTAAPSQFVAAGPAWVLITDRHGWNQSAEYAQQNGTDFSVVDWSVLDGMIGVNPMPGYFTTKREFTAAVNQVGPECATGNASLGWMPLSQVNPAGVRNTIASRHAFDAVSVVFRAVSDLANSLTQLRPTRQRLSFLLSGAIARSSFVGAMGSVRFRRDASRLGDLQTARFSYSQIVQSNYSSVAPPSASTLPFGAGLQYAEVGQWTPVVGATPYPNVIRNTPLTRVMLAAFNRTDAIKTAYRTMQHYTEQFWAPTRVHSEQPSARYGSCFAVSSVLQRGFLVGGTASGSSGALTDVYELDFVTEQWSRRMTAGTETPVARYYAACSTFQQEIIMFGGQNLNGVHSDAWSFSLRKNAWRLIIPDGVIPGRSRSSLVYDSSWLGRMVLWGGGHEQDSSPSLYFFQPQVEFAVSSMLPIAREPLPPINQTLMALQRDFELPDSIPRFLRIRHYNPTYNRTMLAYTYTNCSNQVTEAAGRGLNVTAGRALLKSQCSSSSPDAVRSALEYLEGVDEVDGLSALNFGMGGYGTVLTIGDTTYYAMISSAGMALLFDINTNQIHPFPLRCPPNVYGGAGGSPDFEPDATGACPLVLDFTHADSLDGIIYAGNSYVTSFPHNDTRSELWALDLKHCIPTTADETTASGQFDGNSTCGLWTLVDTFGARGQSLDTRASGFFDYNLVIFGGYDNIASLARNALDVVQTDPDVAGPQSSSLTPMTNRLHNDHLTPPARAAHSIVQWGTQLIIFGGLVLEASSDSPLLQQAQQSGKQLLGTNQVFAYDLISQAWTVQPPKNAPPNPTFEHVAFMLRGAMYVFGGINSDGTFLNLLYRYEPAAQLWSLLGPNGITTTNSSSSNSTSADTPNTVLWPPGRASAVAFTVGDSTAFVGFGVDPTGKELADLWSFTFHTPDCAPSYPDPTSPARPCLDSQWQRVGVSSTFDANKHPRPPTAQFVTVSPAVADGVAVFVDQRNWLLVFGGTGQSSTTANNSYYLCEMKLNTATPSVCTWFLVPLPGDSPLINPLVGASAVLLWPYVLITGGAVWELVNLYVLRLNLLTFQWDGLAPQRIGAGAAADAATRILTQSWVPIRPLIDGVAIEYANGAFFHGGYTTGGVGQDGVWDRNSLVAELFFLGANASCPDGFNASTVSASLSGLADCTPCSAGTFSARGWCFPCPAGTYRSSSNATCLNCPAGTYGSFAGAQQATDCTPCAAGTMQNRTGQSTCDACPPDDSCLMLSSSPLNSAQWNQFFPKLGVVPVAGAALPAAEGTGGVDSQAALIVGIIIAIVAFALIIAYGCLQWSFTSDDGFQKVSFLFNGAHANRLSSEFWARKMQELAPQGTEKAAIAIDRATSMGGLFSLLCILLFVFFIVTLSVTYVRDNVREERSLIPATEGLSINVEVGMQAVVTLYYMTPVNQTSWCVSPEGAGGCTDRTSMSLAKEDFKIDMSTGANTKYCYEGPLADTPSITRCVIQWSNARVSVLRGVVPVIMTVAAPNAYALGFDWEFSFTSGLPGFTSSVKSGLRTDGKGVLRGMTSPSHVNLTLTPTRHQAYGENQDSAGYLVQLRDQQLGQQLSADQFQSDQGVRVTFLLQQSSSTLLITKRPLQSPTQFVSGLLGALSGVVGVLAFLLGKAEAGENKLLRWLSKGKPQGHPAVRRWENSPEWQLFRARPDLVQAEVARKSTVGASGSAMAVPRGSGNGTALLGKAGSTTNLHGDAAGRGRAPTKLQPRMPSIIAHNNPLHARGSISVIPSGSMVPSPALADTPAGFNDSTESIEMSDWPVNRRLTELAEEDEGMGRVGAGSDSVSSTSAVGAGASVAMMTPGVARPSFAMHRGSVLASPSAASAAASLSDSSATPPVDSRPQYVRSNSLVLPIQRSMSPRPSVATAEPAAAQTLPNASASASASRPSVVASGAVSPTFGARRSVAQLPLVTESVASDDVDIDHDGMLHRRPTHLPDA